MATVPQTPRHSAPSHPDRKHDQRRQFRKDLALAGGIIVGLVALFALMVWLASLGAAPQDTGIEHWMLP